MELILGHTTAQVIEIKITLKDYIMKKILILPFILFTVYSCTKVDIIEYENLIVSETINDSIVKVDVQTEETPTPPMSNEPSIIVHKNSNYFDYSDGLKDTYHYANSKKHFNVGGQEYLLIASTGDESHLYKRNDTIWDLVDTSNQNKIVGGSEITMLSETDFVIAETGEDHRIPHSEWGGYVWLGSIQNEKISYTKITDAKSYYTTVSYGDLDDNGLIDINCGSWFFMQETNNQYKTVNVSTNTGTSFGTNIDSYKDSNFDLLDTSRFHELNSQSITHKVVDIYPGGRDEMIFAFVDLSDRVSESEVAPRGDVLIYEFDETSNQYKVVYELPRRTVGEVETISTIKVADVNNDGLLDILLSVVSGDSADERNPYPPIEVWLGKNDKTFYKQDEFIKEVDTVGFETLDVNNDGYLDVVLNPFGDSADWIRNWCSSDCGSRTQAGESVKDGLLLHKTIYLNDGTGKFSRIQKEIIIDNTYTTWMYAFMRNGNLSFIGGNYKNFADSTNPNSTAPMDIEIIDIELKNYF